MPNRVATLRSSVPGALPQAGTRQPGELWLNFVDSALGFIDGNQDAQKLLAVRLFVNTANYAIGDFVVYAGNLYRAIAPSAPSAFVGANWSKVGTAQDMAAYLPLMGGTMTGQLVLAADPSAAAGAATKRYVDAGDALKLSLVGGTMTGKLVLSGPPTDPLDAVTKAYADTGAFLPVSGGTLTGALAGTTASFSGAVSAGGSVSATGLGSFGTTVSVGTTLYPSYNSAGTAWYFTQTGGNRLHNWAPSWTDYWRGSDGLRVWTSTSGNAMTLTGAGQLNLLSGVNVMNDPNFYMGGNASERYLQFGAAWYWGWNTATGALRWVGGGPANAQEVFTLTMSGLTLQGNMALSTNSLTVRASMTGASANFSGSCNAGPSTIGGITLSGQTITSANHFPYGNNSASCGAPGQAWFQVASYAFPLQSDPREKKNIADAPFGALTRVNSVPVHTYNWLQEDDGAPLHTGWLATEVDAALSQHSEAVVVIGEDDRQSLALSLGEMVAVLWQAVQELSARVTQLEAAA